MARTAALGKLSLGDLQKEISRRKRTVTALERRRAGLVKKIEAIDAQIASNGGAIGGRRGAAAGTGRTRARNETNLLESLREVLKGKTMSVTEVAEAVQKAGYQTTSPNFRTIVNQTLLKKKFFKRVGRGQYTAA